MEANDFSMIPQFSVFDDQEVSEEGNSLYSSIINRRSFATYILVLVMICTSQDLIYMFRYILYMCAYREYSLVLNILVKNITQFLMYFRIQLHKTRLIGQIHILILSHCVRT